LKTIGYILAVLLALATITRTPVYASTDSDAIASADFSKDQAGWTFGGAAIPGTPAKLSVGKTGMHGGALLLLDSPVRIPAEDGASLHLRWKIDSFSDTSGNIDNKCTGRFFLAPAPLPSFVDPYSLPNEIDLIVNHNGLDDTMISLYSKVDGKSGYGTLLYQGAIDPTLFPLTIDLLLTKDTYRLKFDKDVLTGAGSKSGYHQLPPDEWSGDLRLGGRIVNGDSDHDSQVAIEQLEASTAR